MNELQEKLEEYYQSWLDYQEQRQKVIDDEGIMLCRYLQERGISIRALANELRITPSFLSKVMRGKEAISPDLARLILDLPHWREEGSE